MATLKEYGLDKKLKKVEKEALPTLEHIKKEDKIFFPDSEKYFSEDELEELLNEFLEFDRTMIHEKYKLVVEELKNEDS